MDWEGGGEKVGSGVEMDGQTGEKVRREGV